MGGGSSCEDFGYNFVTADGRGSPWTDPNNYNNGDRIQTHVKHKGVPVDIKAVREQRQGQRARELRRLEKLEEKKAYGFPVSVSLPKFKQITTEISAKQSIFSSDDDKAHFVHQVKMTSSGTKFLNKNKQMKVITSRDGDRSQHLGRISQDESYDRIPDPDVLRVPVKAVLNSLTTGIPYPALTSASAKKFSSTSSNFRRNYLERQQEAQEKERSKGKGLGWKTSSYKAPAIEDRIPLSTRQEFTLPKVVKNLPTNLKILGQSTNDFYKPVEAEDQQLRPEGDTALKALYEHSEPFHRLLMAMKKFKLTTSVVQKLKKIEEMRLRDRAHVRKQEQEVHQATLRKMNSKVLERSGTNPLSEDKHSEDHVATVQREAQKAAQQARREEEERERERRYKQYMMKQKKQLQRWETQVSSSKQVLLAGQQDPFSAKKILSAKPYKSYWLLCVDECLKFTNLYGELSQETEVQPADDLGRGCEPGYYRVVLPKHSRETSQAIPADLEEMDLLGQDVELETHPIDLLWSEELLNNLFNADVAPLAEDLAELSDDLPQQTPFGPQHLVSMVGLSEMTSIVKQDIQREHEVLYRVKL